MKYIVQSTHNPNFFYAGRFKEYVKREKALVMNEEEASKVHDEQHGTRIVKVKEANHDK